MADPYLAGVDCIAFDFCGTLAELRPTSEELLGGWLENVDAGHFAPATLTEAIMRTSAEMPYSSLKVRDAHERRTYYVRFNAHVLALLGCDDADGEALYEHFTRHERHWTLRPGATALLRELAKRGYQVVLASNFDPTLERLLARDSTASLFDALFVSASLGLEKPDPAFYHHVRDTLGLEASAIAMVGDDLNLDVRPALATGMKAVHLRPDAVGLAGSRWLQVNGYLEVTTLDDLLPVCTRAGK